MKKNIEQSNSIENVLIAAKVNALNKIYIPKDIKKKYKFVVNKKTKQTVIEKR